jgi:hypothetical protein
LESMRVSIKLSHVAISKRDQPTRKKRDIGKAYERDEKWILAD